jgi:transposase InsO family protein
MIGSAGPIPSGRIVRTDSHLKPLESGPAGIYRDRAEARQDVFDYIELFYNPRRRHSHLGRKSPMVYEQEYFQSMESV